MFKIEKDYINDKKEEFKFDSYEQAYQFFKECLKDLEEIKFIKFYTFDKIYKLKIKYSKEKDLLKFL